jgi:hypothetical protein
MGQGEFKKAGSEKGSRSDQIAFSTIPVDRLWISLWKFSAAHIALDLSSDCLFFGRPIGLQIPWSDALRYFGE